MSAPCEQQELIKEIRDDVKTLLAYHHQAVGKRKMMNKLTKIVISVLTLLSGIIYGVKH